MYTPHHLVKHPDQPCFYTIESDNNTLPPELRAQLIAESAKADDKDGSEEDSKGLLPPEEFGYPRGRGRWASCVGVVDSLGEQVIQKVHLEGNEAATSAAVVPFTSQDNESFLILIVGTGKDMVINPRQFSRGYLYVYRFHQDGRELEFIHETEVEEPPTTLVSFPGRLAVGIGKMLRIYDLGLKQMLRKPDANVAPQLIVSLQSQGNRFIVGDVQ